jgi:hypothetical protein
MFLHLTFSDKNQSPQSFASAATIAYRQILKADVLLENLILRKNHGIMSSTWLVTPTG